VNVNVYSCVAVLKNETNQGSKARLLVAEMSNPYGEGERGSEISDSSPAEENSPPRYEPPSTAGSVLHDAASRENQRELQGGLGMSLQGPAPSLGHVPQQIPHPQIPYHHPIQQLPYPYGSHHTYQVPHPDHVHSAPSNEYVDNQISFSRQYNNPNFSSGMMPGPVGTGRTVDDEGVDEMVHNEQSNLVEIPQARTSDVDQDEMPATTDEVDLGPVKLFVGQVPKSMSEEALFPTFSVYGPIKELLVIRDKHTGQHRGCAFVTFWSSTAALKVQEELHDQFVFPNGRKPVQVRPATESSLHVHVHNSEQENKLFIGMTARNADENSIRELFAPFGEIREIYIIRNADGSNKGCAFLKFAAKESSLAAIDALHEKHQMEGATRPLIVKFADRRGPMRKIRHVPEQMGPGQYGDPIFYPPPHQVHVDFGRYRQDVVHYQSFPGAPGGTGAQQTVLGYPPPFYSGYPRGGASPVPSNHSAENRGDIFENHAPRVQPRHANRRSSPRPPGRGAYQPRPDGASNPRPREGPPGANLFIYHLPHDLTDADLATAFNPFGNVISAKVYVDKYTGESKGFGFVSYDQVISAEQAIEQMNGFQIGSKRLKVQHKRVNKQMGAQTQHLKTEETSSTILPQQVNAILPHQHNVSDQPAISSHPDNQMRAEMPQSVPQSRFHNNLGTSLDVDGLSGELEELDVSYHEQN